VWQSGRGTGGCPPHGRADNPMEETCRTASSPGFCFQGRREAEDRWWKSGACVLGWREALGRFGVATANAANTRDPSQCTPRLISVSPYKAPRSGAPFPPLYKYCIWSSERAAARPMSHRNPALPPGEYSSLGVVWTPGPPRGGADRSPSCSPPPRGGPGGGRRK
jgi:hypothetical protein